MAVSFTSPVTGTAQTGLTSPTYTLTSMQAPSPNGKQWAITALGGTQTGVEVHSLSAPFTITAFAPQNPKVLGVPNPSTGVIYNVPRNVTKQIVRKGVQVAANQPYQTMLVEVTISVPAGADTYDPESVRAALSLAIGGLSQQSAGYGDSSVTGAL